MYHTHSKQLHRYRNRYFFTQICIELLSEDETDYSDNADHKNTNVCLWNEVTNFQHSLEKNKPKRTVIARKENWGASDKIMHCICTRTMLISDICAVLKRLSALLTFNHEDRSKRLNSGHHFNWCFYIVEIHVSLQGWLIRQTGRSVWLKWRE